MPTGIEQNRKYRAVGNGPATTSKALAWGGSFATCASRLLDAKPEHSEQRRRQGPPEREKADLLQPDAQRRGDRAVHHESNRNASPIGWRQGVAALSSGHGPVAAVT